MLSSFIASNITGCIGVAKFGRVDDNFDNVDWLISIGVSYSPPTNQTIYEARDTTVTTIHNRDKDHKPTPQYTLYWKVPEGNRAGPYVEVRCKINTSAGANGCVQQCLIPLGKLWKSLTLIEPP